MCNATVSFNNCAKSKLISPGAEQRHVLQIFLKLRLPATGPKPVASKSDMTLRRKACKLPTFVYHGFDLGSALSSKNTPKKSACFLRECYSSAPSHISGRFIQIKHLHVCHCCLSRSSMVLLAYTNLHRLTNAFCKDINKVYRAWFLKRLKAIVWNLELAFNKAVHDKVENNPSSNPLPFSAMQLAISISSHFNHLPWLPAVGTQGRWRVAVTVSAISNLRGFTESFQSN